jgi:hypothetical protein
MRMSVASGRRLMSLRLVASRGTALENAQFMEGTTPRQTENLSDMGHPYSYSSYRVLTVGGAGAATDVH